MKAAQLERQNKAQRVLDEMNQLLSVQNSPATLSAADERAPALGRKKARGFLAAGQAAGQALSSEEHLRFDQTLRLFCALQKAQSMQQCGLVGSLSADDMGQFAKLVAALVQRLELNRGLMRETYSAYQNLLVSSLYSVDCPDRKAAHKFLELACIWTDVDSGAFVDFSIYVPPKVWTSRQDRFDLQRELCKQVAQAAGVDALLVDIVSIALDSNEKQHGMEGNALVRLMAKAPGLELTILSGTFWPASDGEKCEVTVGVRLVSLKGKEVSASAGSDDDGTNINFQANQARQVQHIGKAKTTPGEIDPVNPRFENETFELLLYAPRHRLIVTVYSLANGIRSIVGEFTVKADEMLSECRRSADLRISRSYGLFHPNSLKPVYYKKHADKSRLKQAEVQVSFRFFTRNALHSPQEMVKRVCKQATVPQSSIRAGGIITGLSFPLTASWETITLYIVSNAIEMKQEREFLQGFVFPALQYKCQALNVHFRWLVMSSYGDGSTEDDVIKRLRYKFLLPTLSVLFLAADRMFFYLFVQRNPKFPNQSAQCNGP